MEPTDLVAGTSYPSAKAERLPTVACRHTEVELQLALLRRDIEWATRTNAAGELPGRWEPLLADLERDAADHDELQLLRTARHELALAVRPLA